MKALFVLVLILATTGSVFGQSSTITWTTTHQTIDGFGGNCENTCWTLTTAQGTTLFSTSGSNIGLSIYRDGVPSDGSCSTSCNFRSGPAITQAIANGVTTFFGSPWSAPASMKTNGDDTCNNGSGDSSVLSGSYGAYATYLQNYASQFQATYGKKLYAISAQNEPDYCPKTYSGAIWTGSQLDIFVKNNLGPTFDGSGTRVMMPESAHYSGLGPLANTCMTDSNCSQYVGIVAVHGYGANYSSYSNLGTTAHLWQTENYIPQDSSSFDPSMANGLLVAQDIHKWLTVANGSAYLWWRLKSSPDDNQGLILESSGQIAKRAYVMGNWSKFVRPGWVRIDATANPTSGVYVTAFKDASDIGFAIVVVNQNSSSANLTLSLDGFPSVTTVTPTLTSASANLVDQSNVDASTGAFSYSLPASSVVTFHGTASSSSAKNVAPPTKLALTVH
jgi:glucuronoarabinoxylan endo-1,4-beta-xylanase